LTSGMMKELFKLYGFQEDAKYRRTFYVQKYNGHEVKAMYKWLKENWIVWAPITWVLAGAIGGLAGYFLMN
jgi:hypothetical protein